MTDTGEIQNKISVLYADSDSTTADYLTSKNVFSTLSPPEYMHRVRVAFLSSYTIQGLPEVFAVRGLFHNVWSDVYTGAYNQFTQEVLNKKSELYSFNPDIVYLLVDSVDVLDTDHLTTVIGNLAETNSQIVVSNFVEPPRGDKKPDVRGLNKVLGQLSEKHPNVYIFDLKSFVDGTRAENWYTKYADLGDLRLSPEAFPQIAERLLAYVVALSGATKKCLVLDLDNTLWEGVVGEDGAQAVQPNKELQRYIKRLRDKGVILAINSKNNEADALEVFEANTEMILSEGDFSALAINWRDKATNIIEIAEKLNIGTDALVFVDDSAFEQELIRKSFPEIAVVPIDSLMEYVGFSGIGETAEDARRAEMYKEEAKRVKAKAQFVNVADYLSTLQLAITIQEASEEFLPRISQLTQKTNQFNVTTRRYSEKDIRVMLENGLRIWTFSATDKFGDYGTVGLAIVKPQEHAWVVDTFLLSCRIMGREVERAFLGYIVGEAKKGGAGEVIGHFIPTTKNGPSGSLFPDNGFVLTQQNEEMRSYAYATEKQYVSPDFLTVYVL